MDQLQVAGSHASFFLKAGIQVSPTLVHPSEASDVIDAEPDMKGFVVNTMAFYKGTGDELEILAGKLSDVIESRDVVVFVPLSVADYDAAGLKQLLTSFRRRVNVALLAIINKLKARQMTNCYRLQFSLDLLFGSQWTLLC